MTSSTSRTSATVPIREARHAQIHAPKRGRDEDHQHHGLGVCGVAEEELEVVRQIDS